MCAMGAYSLKRYGQDCHGWLVLWVANTVYFFYIETCKYNPNHNTCLAGFRTDATCWSLVQKAVGRL